MYTSILDIINLMSKVAIFIIQKTVLKIHALIKSATKDTLENMKKVVDIIKKGGMFLQAP